MMAGYVREWSIKSSETTAAGLPVFADGIVLVFDACLCEGLAGRVVVVVRLFASLRRCCYQTCTRCQRDRHSSWGLMLVFVKDLLVG